jgi:hypothetical protein
MAIRLELHAISCQESRQVIVKSGRVGVRNNPTQAKEERRLEWCGFLLKPISIPG